MRVYLALDVEGAPPQRHQPASSLLPSLLLPQPSVYQLLPLVPPVHFGVTRLHLLYQLAFLLIPAQLRSQGSAFPRVDEYLLIVFYLHSCLHQQPHHFVLLVLEALFNQAGEIVFPLLGEVLLQHSHQGSRHFQELFLVFVVSDGLEGLEGELEGIEAKLESQEIQGEAKVREFRQVLVAQEHDLLPNVLVGPRRVEGAAAVGAKGAVVLGKEVQKVQALVSGSVAQVIGLHGLGKVALVDISFLPYRPVLY